MPTCDERVDVVKGDVDRPKAFIEERGRATGSWRGETPPDGGRPRDEAGSA